jgi:alpha-D-xyloside xylohydrolase
MEVFLMKNNGLVWELKHEVVRIEPWGENSLRVRITRNAEIRDDLPGSILQPNQQVADINIQQDAGRVTNGLILAEITDKGRIRFLNSKTQQVLLEELHQVNEFIGPKAREIRPIHGDLIRAEISFAPQLDERFYGLGQQQHGFLNQKGCVVDFQQRNSKVCIPFVISSRGYGFLWHNPAVGRVELGNNATRWVAEATRQVDYWITAGETPADILMQYTGITGKSPMLPEWAAGFWQCKLRYRSQEELLSVAREYKKRGLPLSVIVIDFFHWTVFGDWKFDPDCWPDPKSMVEELNGMGVKVMVSIWPTVNSLSENFDEMQSRGYLLHTEHGVSALWQFMDNQPVGKVYLHHYDPTNPEARKYLWNKVRDNYYKLGIKVWWLDACEPELEPMDPGNICYHLGNGLEITNLYPFLHQKGFYEGMQSEGEDEIVLLCRSAWAGSQRFGAAVWSGDIPSTFEALQRQIRAGLNIAMSGIPWWTTDIGGFIGGDPRTEYFRELIVRWFQYGVFCPLFRLHGMREPVQNGSGAPNEVWSFGDDVFQILRPFLFMRERLKPYIMKQMELAHKKGIPPMRPLFFDYPNDPGCVDIDTQFLFGPDLLVAPVIEQGAISRPVYLPAGVEWKDAWDDQIYQGGQTIKADAPLNRVPVYLRNGADLPIKER